MAVTPWLLDGFEHNRLVASANDPYDAAAGAGTTLTIGTSPVRSGARSLSVAPVGTAACRAGKTTPASSRSFAMSFYIRFASLPGADCTLALFTNASGTGQFRFHNSTSSFMISNQGVGQTDVGPTVATNTWYLVDLYYDSNGGGTTTIKARIDMGTEVSVSRSQADADCTAVSLGTTATTETYGAFYDDWVVSLDKAEYPIGPHHVESLIPDSDGTHNITTSGDFDSFSTTQFSNADSTTGGVACYPFIGHRPMQLANTADQVIRQELGTTTDYMEFGLENLANNALTVWGVRAYGCWVESSGTGASLGEMRLLLAAGTEVTTTSFTSATTISMIDSTEDPGITVNVRARMTNAPSGGWDGTKVDGLKIRLGFGDNDPDVNFIDAMIEVLQQDSVAATATPSVVSVVTATPAPTVTAPADAPPPTVELLMSTPSPTVVASGSATATPAKVSVVVRVPAPGIPALPPSAHHYSDGYGQGYETIEEPEPETPPERPFPSLYVLIDTVNDLNPAQAVATTPVWTDATSWVRSFSLRRGRQRPLDRNEATTASLVLDNREAQVEPQRGVMEGIAPMRHVSVSAQFTNHTTAFKTGASKTGGTHVTGGGERPVWEPVFDGYIESMAYNYVQNRDASVTLNCVDIMGVLQRPTAYLGFDRTRYIWEEMHRVLNLRVYTGRIDATNPYAKSPQRDISERSLNLASTFDATTLQYTQASLREHLETLAMADGGNFFIARDGRPTYRDPDWNLRPAIARKFGVDFERYHDIAQALDETLVFNTVYVRDNAGNVATATSAVSAQQFEERTYDITIAAAGGLQERADALLLRYGRARKYLAKLDLMTAHTDWRDLLKAELWDTVVVEVPNPDGFTETQRSQLEGIEINASPQTGWQMAFWLSVPPFPPLLTDADDRSFEGDDGLGSTGAWVAETNCTLLAQNEQRQHTQQHYGGPHNGERPVIYLKPIYAADGVWVLQAEATGNGDVTILSPEVSVAGRGDYRATLKARLVAWNTADIAATESSRPCHLEMVWYDASSVELSATLGTATTVGNHYQTWVTLAVDAVAPTGAIYSRLRVVSDSVTSGTAGLLIDQVDWARGG